MSRTIDSIQEPLPLNAVERFNDDGSVHIRDLPTATAEPIQKTASVSKDIFANPALEIMKLGLAMENFQTEKKLASYKKEAESYKEINNALLNVNALLVRLPEENATHEISDELKKHLTFLDQKNIQILPHQEKTFTKAQLIGAKSLISSRIDECRMKYQDLFATKISTSIQFLNTMNDIMKEISRKADRLVSTILSNSMGR